MVYKDETQLKEYNRSRAQRLYDDYLQRRDVIMGRLGGECYLCRAPAAKGFHLHHVKYHPTESDYPRTGGSMYVRLKRLKEAERHPERFRLLCPGCHGALELLKPWVGKMLVMDVRRLQELL